MSKKKNKFKLITSIILIFVFLIVAFNNIINWNKNLIKTSTAFGEKNLNASLQINDPSTEYQQLNVLIIEINPLLTSITNTELYGEENEGHPLASQFLYYNDSEYRYMVAVDEMVEDIQDMSHGYIKINTTKEILNEFPTWTVEVDLNNGSKSNRLDEETFISYGRVPGTDYGTIWNFYGTDLWSQTAYNFDYHYLIEKFNLEERRNNGEFDQVWIYAIDMSQVDEWKMVGRDNERMFQNGITADCKPFMMPGISMSRRDANLHAYCHWIENVMENVFIDNLNATPNDVWKSFDDKNHPTRNITNVEEYKKLNLWDQFTLTKYNNSGNDLSSVGIVHYPFNGTNKNNSGGYDYDNTENVLSNWQDWLNYPNFTYEWNNWNCNAWMNNTINTSLGDDENKDPDRLYNRFWLYLMPHVTGYTDDGHLNNWWKYLYSLDYVREIIRNDEERKEFNVGEKIEVDYTLKYNSGKDNNLYKITEGNNIQIGNKSVVDFVNGELYAVGEGYSTIKINFDGRSIEYIVEVGKNIGDIGIRVVLNKTNLELTEFQTEKLIATVIGDQNIEIKWRSEDTNVVTVDNDGNVTAVGVGQTTIKVETVDGIELARCEVKVKEIEPFVPPPIEPPIEIRLNVEFINYSVNETNDEIAYLKNIKLNEKISDLKNNTKTNGEMELLNEEGNAITDENEILKTGMKLKITGYGEEKVYILVITADITGDGKSDTRDLLKLARYLSKLENISGPYYLAANIYKDTDDVNNADLLKYARILVQLDTFD